MTNDSQPAPARLRGFAIPGYASAAGKKGHALGVTPQWTRAQARAAGRRAQELRRQRATAQAGVAAPGGSR